MKTVDKAFRLLDQFQPDRTEIGLSELARLAGLDKAATRRLLVALGAHGFIEQNGESRKYRLGPGFLRLAHLREATVPMAASAQEVCDWLNEVTGDSVHVSIPGPQSMLTLAFRMPGRGHVININPAEPLPYHATSAGHVFLAFASAETRARVLGLARPRFARGTVTDAAALTARIEAAREAGHALNRDTFEDEVSSVAMAFFARAGEPAGTLSVALPSVNLTEGRLAELLPLLAEGVSRLERAITGTSAG